MLGKWKTFSVLCLVKWGRDSHWLGAKPLAETMPFVIADWLLKLFVTCKCTMLNPHEQTMWFNVYLDLMHFITASRSFCCDTSIRQRLLASLVKVVICLRLGTKPWGKTVLLLSNFILGNEIMMLPLWIAFPLTQCVLISLLDMQWLIALTYSKYLKLTISSVI